MVNAATDRQRPSPEPCLEHVLIPPDRSFLWRKDDYPVRRSVWNQHPEVEIHLIRHSSGLSYVGDHIGLFGPGDLCLLGSDLPHNWVTHDMDEEILPDRDVVVQFDPAAILKGCAAFPEMRLVPGLLNRARQGIRFTGETARIGRDMLEAMEHAPNGQGAAVLLGLLHRLALSEEYWTLASLPFVESIRPTSADDLDRLQRALAFMQDRFVDRPGLCAAARVAGMSETAFSRFFKRRTGNSFTEHLVSLRISAAQRLLADTDDGITDICYRAGFNNISNFNRTFLRKVGMAPSAYRRAAMARA